MTPQPVAPAPGGPTGPRTEEGKARTRLNAFRHGLTGQVFVFSPEEAESFKNHTTAIRGHYQPAGPLEEALTDQIATGIWRLQRVAAIEQGIFTTDSATRADDEAGPAYTWLQQDKAFALLSLYEGRIRRALDRDKLELQSLQTARMNEAAQAMNQAVALHNQAKAEGKPYNPEYFRTPPPVKESVFSTEIVAAEATRRDAMARLNRKAA
jgi:hypothetical protein